MSDENSDTALSGILVLEVGGRVGAGVCGSLLAQLGAETVLAERPARADFTAGKACWRDQFVAGKLSFRPDPDDPDLLRRLAAAADVVILSSDVDPPLLAVAAEAAGIDAVVCDITAYGAGAPKSGRGAPASDWRLQAETGVADTTGRKDGPPVPSPLPVIEYMTGVYAAAAVVAALRVRRLGGGGQFIDMALYDSGFASLATFFPKLLLGGTEPVERAGNNHALISPWNVYKAADGWILICAGSDAQWERLCAVMGRDDVNAAGDYARMAARITYREQVDAIITTWTLGRTVADCAEALNAASLANGAIVTLDPHPREPNLGHRGMIRELDDGAGGTFFVPGSPLIMSATPGRAPDRLPAPDADRDAVANLVAEREAGAAAVPAPAAKPALPMAGLRVVEVGHYTTVPLSTRHMGALGADVIKVEPPGGEATRGWLPVHEGRSFYFAYVNSDKRSLVLDLASDAGVEVFRRLIETADVLIENLKPGALARRGFSAENIAKINPRLIYCAVSGFGHASLYAGRPAYDSVVQAMSGIMEVVRDDGIPMKTGISIVDLLGAEMALVAVLAALEYRDRTNRGQFIDLSMQDIAAWMTQIAWNGKTEPAVPLTVVACADGHVLAEAAVEAVTCAAGGDMTMTDGKGASNLTRADLAARLTGAGLAAVPILPVHEVISAAHTRRRKLWFTVPDAGVDWPLLASALQLSRTPPRVRRPMPVLGRDDTDILAELGLAPVAENAD